MLQYLNSSLFSSPARVLVNTVNTVGVMGKGIALEFKTRYPDMYEEYRDLCRANRLTIGTLWLYRTTGRWILNFPTKKDWRHPSRPEYLQAGLEKFVASYEAWGVDSVSFPLLGCGNGRLDFDSQVKPLMERYLSKLPIPVYVHTRTEDETFVPEHEEPDLFSSPVPLKFADFWRDVRQLSEQSPELSLRTFSSESPFRLAYAAAGHLAFLRENDTEVRIPRSDLKALWTRLRLTGSVKSSDAPGRIGREFALVFPFLSLLPYLDPVEMSDQWKGIHHNPATGLQLRFDHAARRGEVLVEIGGG